MWCALRLHSTGNPASMILWPPQCFDYISTCKNTSVYYSFWNTLWKIYTISVLSAQTMQQNVDLLNSITAFQNIVKTLYSYHQRSKHCKNVLGFIWKRLLEGVGVSYSRLHRLTWSWGDLFHIMTGQKIINLLYLGHE